MAELLDRFIDIGRQVNAEDIARVTIEVAGGMPGVQSVGLWWLDTPSQTLTLAGRHGQVPARPLTVRSRSRLANLLTTTAPKTFTAAQTPLKVSGKHVVIAAIGDEFRQLGLIAVGFSEIKDDTAMSVGAVARQCATSAANSARLRQLLDSTHASQQQAQKLQRLNQVVDRLARIRTEDELMQAIPDLACEALGYSYALVESVSGSKLILHQTGAWGDDAARFNKVMGSRRVRRLAPDGLVAEAIERKEPILISDTQSDPRVTRRAIKQELAYLVAVPFLDENGQVAAVIQVAQRRPASYRVLPPTPADLELLNVFSQLATFALSGIRYANFKQQGIDIARLPARSVEEFASAVVEKLPGITTSAGAIISLPNDAGELIPVAASDPALITPRYRRWIAKLPFSRARFTLSGSATTGHPIYEHSVVLPIRYEDENLGLIHLTEKRSGIFTPQDVEFSNTIVTRIGYVLKNLEFVHQLGKESRLFSSIVHNTADGIISLDEEGRVRFFNAAMETITGFRGSEVLKRGADVTFQPQTEDGQPYTFASMTADPDNHTARTVSIVTQSGERKWVGITSTPRVSVDGLLLTILVIRDITQEHQLFQRQREFVSIASHELRTPITALMGYLSLTQSSNEEEQKEHFVSRAYAAANRLSELVEDLLAAARIEEGRMSLSLRPVDPSEITGEVIQNLSPAATGKDQRLIFTNRLPHGTKVEADRSKLHQVIANLIDNAIKYTPEKGQIKVTVAGGSRNVTITVQDSGIGIHPDNMERIFDKFFREYTELSVAAGGTGLGLFITRELTERQGGTLEISSRHGQGTTARIRFKRLATATKARNQAKS